MSLVADAVTSDQATPSGLLVVIFRIAQQQYALPLEAVLQVVRLPALTTVPDMPQSHCGLLNLRGSFLPVLDARILLGEAPAAALESQIIILSSGPRSASPGLGVLVDAVDGVRHYPLDSFAAYSGASPLVAGMLRERDEAVVLLDPATLAARTSLSYSSYAVARGGHSTT